MLPDDPGRPAGADATRTRGSPPVSPQPAGLVAGCDAGCPAPAAAARRAAWSSGSRWRSSRCSAAAPCSCRATPWDSEGRPNPGRRRRRTRRSSRSGTRTARSAIGSRSARWIARRVIEGAIRGMVEAIGDPYSTYLSSEEFRVDAPGHLRRVRGDRRRDRDGERRRRDDATARSSGRTAGSSSSPRSKGRRPRRPA